MQRPRGQSRGRSSLNQQQAQFPSEQAEPVLPYRPGRALAGARLGAARPRLPNWDQYDHEIASVVPKSFLLAFTSGGRLSN